MLVPCGWSQCCHGNAAHHVLYIHVANVAVESGSGQASTFRAGIYGKSLLLPQPTTSDSESSIRKLQPTRCAPPSWRLVGWNDPVHFTHTDRTPSPRQMAMESVAKCASLASLSESAASLCEDSTILAIARCLGSVAGPARPDTGAFGHRNIGMLTWPVKAGSGAEAAGLAQFSTLRKNQPLNSITSSILTSPDAAHAANPGAVLPGSRQEPAPVLFQH